MRYINLRLTHFLTYFRRPTDAGYTRRRSAYVDHHLTELNGTNSIKEELRLRTAL